MEELRLWIDARGQPQESDRVTIRLQEVWRLTHGRFRFGSTPRAWFATLQCKPDDPKSRDGRTSALIEAPRELAPGSMEITVVKTLHFRQKSGANGHLRIDIEVGKPDAECDVVVVIEPRVAPNEWLPGFWEQMSQGWQGEPLVRPPQGEFEKRDSLR